MLQIGTRHIDLPKTGFTCRFGTHEAVFCSCAFVLGRPLSPMVAQNQTALRRRQHPNAHNVIKRVQVVSPPSSGGMGRPGEGAPGGDRLGELLRLYSELSSEKKARALDYVNQLHNLDHASGDAERPPRAPPNTFSTSTRQQPLSPPPQPGQSPPSFRMGTRPAPLQVPPISVYDSVESSQSQMMTVGAPSGSSPVELRVTLTGDQLRGLADTLTGRPAPDQLDGFVQSVFTPQAPPAAHWGFAPPNQPLSAPPTGASRLGRQFGASAAAPAPSASMDGGGESIYAMLNPGPPARPTGVQVPPQPMGWNWPGQRMQSPPMPPMLPPAQHPMTYPQGVSMPYSAPNWVHAPVPAPFRGPEPPAPGVADAALRPPATPPPFVHPQAAAPQLIGEHRNLHDTATILNHAYGGSDPYDVKPGSRGDRRPFMQSLTSMHHSPTRVEASLAARRRSEWLSELGEQVRVRDEARAAERAEREIDDLKEELRAREWREEADEALRAELSQRKAPKKKMG